MPVAQSAPNNDGLRATTTRATAAMLAPRTPGPALVRSSRHNHTNNSRTRTRTRSRRARVDDNSCTSNNNAIGGDSGGGGDGDNNDHIIAAGQTTLQERVLRSVRKIADAQWGDAMG